MALANALGIFLWYDMCFHRRLAGMAFPAGKACYSREIVSIDIRMRVVEADCWELAQQLGNSESVKERESSELLLALVSFETLFLWRVPIDSVAEAGCSFPELICW
ncbi:hypothetical protein WN943_012470 [Citrus x changshan-huyou]